ncbi:MAG: hypothetical protein K2M93_04965 [Muribaculaceae bacterium]|nr:hypothetical protein [Muribaculaceae bacterium]
MKKTFTLIALLIGLAGINHARAQRDNRSHEEGVVTVVGNENADASDVEKVFKHNAPQTPNVNGLPRFALVGKEGKFYIGLGAQFLGEGVFDWGDQMPSALDMTPSSILPRTPGNGSNLRFGWQTSSIYMNVVAMPGNENQIGLFFKANFTGANNGFNVSHLYAKYRGLTVGLTNSLFIDGEAEPFTIDNEGPNGYPDMTVFTAYWVQDFTKNFSGAIGIDAPSVSFSYAGATEKVNQRIPAIPLYLQYAWGGGDSHIRLSGIVRPMLYRDVTAGKNMTIVGGGVQLSGMTHIVGGLSAQFNGAFGKGIGNYLQDDNELGLDAVATTDSGKMKAVTSMGVTGGLSYQFSPKLTGNICYSHLTNWMPDDAVDSGDTYRYGDYCTANLVYAFNKFISAGVEYDYGHRKALDGTGLHTNRVQAQLAVTF